MRNGEVYVDPVELDDLTGRPDASRLLAEDDDTIALRNELLGLEALAARARP
jgi:hypothetical protein